MDSITKDFVTQKVGVMNIMQKIGDKDIIYNLSGGQGEDENKNGDKDGKGKGEDGEDGDGKKDGEGEGKDGEGEGEDGDKGKDGKCVGKDTCAGDKLASKLSAPANKLRSLDTMLRDKVNNSMKDAWKNLTDKAKCPIYVAEKIPDMIPNMIEKIGKSTAGAFDNVANSIKNLFDQVSGQEIKGYPNIFGPFEVAYAFVIIKIQNVINQLALGADADKILADPAIKSGELLAKMMRTSKRYKDAIKEAELQDIFKDWIKNYTDALLETLDIAKPEIDRINTELKNIIEGMGDNIGESLSHALVNVVRSVVSNIPIVGGIVSAVMSADELGQEIINACKPPVAKGAGIIMPIVNGVNKQVDKTKCQVDKLVKKIEPLMLKLENKANSVGEKVNSKVEKMSSKMDEKVEKMSSKMDEKVEKSKEGGGGGGGGGRQKKTVKNIGKRINNATRRVEYMLSRFRNKTRGRHHKKRKLLTRHKKKTLY